MKKIRIDLEGDVEVIAYKLEEIRRLVLSGYNMGYGWELSEGEEE